MLMQAFILHDDLTTLMDHVQKEAVKNTQRP
jgi:hypothetical protein